MTYAKLELAFGISMATMLASGATTVVLSSDAASDGLSPGQIFKRAQENYASLASYSDKGKIVVTMNGTTTSTTFTTPSQTAWAFRTIITGRNDPARR